MDLREKFEREQVWYKKAIALETFHLFRYFQFNQKWTVRDTARELECSIGRVSEDLKLAAAIHNNEYLKKLSRNKALRVINGKDLLDSY